MIKICSICQTKFISYRNIQKYCSIKCSKINKKKYFKIYCQEHKEERKKYLSEHNLEITEQHKEYLKNYYNTLIGKAKRVLWGINYRCNNTKSPRFKAYGKRGIKNNLTQEQLKELIIKYNVIRMVKMGLEPQIHRINNDGNYEIGNVEFLSKKEHQNIHRQEKRRINGL